MRKMKVPSVFRFLVLLDVSRDLDGLHAGVARASADSRGRHAGGGQMLEAGTQGKILRESSIAPGRKRVDAGNGVTIPLGAAATVTLAKADRAIPRISCP